VSITRSDRRADLFVWVDYAPLLANPTGVIEAYVFRARDVPAGIDRLLLSRTPPPIRIGTVRLARVIRS
jgi:hypothetical protein